LSKSVIQDWVATLGLRHQGVLLTGVRGCDSAPKDDPSKLFVRCFRATILNAHCGDPRRARTFIQEVDESELRQRFQDFRRNCDHYPHHYVAHLLHCCEVVGYKHPDSGVRQTWLGFYQTLCHGLHVTAETEEEMDGRLNADEEAFAARDWTCDGRPVCASKAG
jgi:hypothetical protein